MPQGAPNLQGRFLLRTLLGQGGMAEVWRAYDSRLGVWRAVKLLLPEYARRTKLRQRFESEARAMALLEHPNIVRVYDVGSEGDQSWIVMELCEGGSLETWLQDHGPMPPRLAIEVIQQVAGGIAHAHSHGVIHRDVKPQNVLITAKGRCKLTDFGIAHFEDTSLTRTGSFMGTLGYMAPEQRSDAKKVDRRTDIYSVGATLFTLLTGRIEMDLFASEQDPSILDELPPMLAPVVARAVAYHREKRFQTMDDLLTDLEAIEHRLPLPAPGEPSLAPRKRQASPPPQSPSVVEQALAEARQSSSDDSPALPGETAMPSYDLFEGSAIPESLRKAVTGQRNGPAPEKARRSDPPPVASPRPSTPRDTDPSYLLEETPRPPEPRVPLPSPRPAKPRDFDFESLYVQSESEASTEVPAPARSFPSDPPAPSHSDPPPDDALVRMPEDSTPTPKVPPPRWRRTPDRSLAGRWFALRAAFHARTGISISPLTVSVVVVVLVVVGGAAASLHGATSLVSAKTAARTQQRSFLATVERQAPSLIDELAWAGGDEETLTAQWERYRLAWAPERQVSEGVTLVALLDQQIDLLDQHPQGPRGTDAEALKRRLRAMHEAYDALEHSQATWRRRGRTVTGRLALRVGLAEQPPPP